MRGALDRAYTLIEGGRRIRRRHDDRERWHVLSVRTVQRVRIAVA
jgi:hypothetical protein